MCRIIDFQVVCSQAFGTIEDTSLGLVAHGTKQNSKLSQKGLWREEFEWIIYTCVAPYPLETWAMAEAFALPAQARPLPVQQAGGIYANYETRNITISS